MKKLLVILLYLANIPKISYGNYDMYIKMVEFNTQGHLYDGGDCDGVFGHGACDPFFLLCLDPKTGSTNSSLDTCTTTYKKCAPKDGYFNNQDDVHFADNTHYTDWNNPQLYHVSSSQWKGAFFKVKAVDKDGFGEGGDDNIDELVVPIGTRQGPLDINAGQAYKQIIWNHPRTNGAAASRTVFSAQVICSDGFEGPDCLVPTTTTTTTTTPTTTTTATTTASMMSSTTTSITTTTTSKSTRPPTTSTTPSTTSSTPTTSTTPPPTSTTPTTTSTTPPTTSTIPPTTSTTQPTISTMPHTTSTTQPTTSTSPPTTSTTPPTTSTTPPTTSTSPPTTSTSPPTTSTTPPLTSTTPPTTSTSTSTTTVTSTTTTTPTTSTTSPLAISTTVPVTMTQLPLTKSSCADWLNSGATMNGFYNITVTTNIGHVMKTVQCDMTTDGGGWTVIQRRSSDTISFERDWYHYKVGFGDESDFWLGNDWIHYLTAGGDQALRIDLRDCNYRPFFTVYDQFQIGDESTSYRLMASMYASASTAGDSLHYDGVYMQDGMVFGTCDNGHDNYYGLCPCIYKGGWWFNRCGASNLNGKYYVGCYYNNGPNPDGIYWHSMRQHYSQEYSFMRVEMKIRPMNFLI